MSSDGTLMTIFQYFLLHPKTVTNGGTKNVSSCAVSYPTLIKVVAPPVSEMSDHSQSVPQ